ncbi:hypothetical protein MYX84_06235 [Acidobacteria bacterium AH-259-O06]|nr:hypothetical protein [Acidobacteria bacterium AH-259-O06]
MIFEGHGGGGDNFTGGSQFNLYKKVSFEDGVLYATQAAWRTLSIQTKPWPYTGFFSSSLPVRSFETTRSIFVGRNRTVKNPRCVEEGICTGMGQYQWTLGEGANWMWHWYVYYILGIRPTLKGLLVDPKIPKEWKRFRLRREYRGATYELEVSNPEHLSSGVRSLVVDGQRIQGQLLPAFMDGRRHRVSVTLGK